MRSKQKVKGFVVVVGFVELASVERSVTVAEAFVVEVEFVAAVVETVVVT